MRETHCLIINGPSSKAINAQSSLLFNLKKDKSVWQREMWAGIGICLELDDKLVIYDILVKRMHLCSFLFIIR